MNRGLHLYTHELAGVHKLAQMQFIPSISFHTTKWNIPESFQIHKFNAQEKFFLQSRIQNQEMCGIGYGVCLDFWTEFRNKLDYLPESV